MEFTRTRDAPETQAMYMSVSTAFFGALLNLRCCVNFQLEAVITTVHVYVRLYRMLRQVVSFASLEHFHF